MKPIVDMHSHVSPLSFPEARSDAAAPRWPCMRCEAGRHSLYMGEKKFRNLDSRSWDVERRLEDMAADGVALQVLSPMPELLSYWLPPHDAEILCDASNHQIAEMIAAAPASFRGLGCVPLQDKALAISKLRRLKADYGLSGIEIGSNLNGQLLGDPELDFLWETVAEEGLAVFVHALHPIAAKPLSSNPQRTAFALFPVDVAMAAASLLMAGIPDRYPDLRLGFSHGGGTLGAMLGRLDTGFTHSKGFGGKLASLPSQAAQRWFYDSNVYDPAYLEYLATVMAPGRIFAGTDYPYDIMQTGPAAFIDSLSLDETAKASLRAGSAEAFLDESLAGV